MRIGGFAILGQCHAVAKEPGGMAANLGASRGLGAVNRLKRRNRGISSTPQNAYSLLKSGDKPAAMCSLTGWEAIL